MLASVMIELKVSTWNGCPNRCAHQLSRTMIKQHEMPRLGHVTRGSTTRKKESRSGRLLADMSMQGSLLQTIIKLVELLKPEVAFPGRLISLLATKH